MMKVNGKSAKKSDRNTIAIGLALAVVFVILGGLVFSYSLETLDIQAKKLKISDENIMKSPFPEYTIPGFENAWGSILLGIASTLCIFGLTIVVANLLKRRNQSRLTK